MNPSHPLVNLSSFAFGAGKFYCQRFAFTAAKDTIKQGKEKFFHFLYCSELIVTNTIVIEDGK
jgi:hypothetical protein